MEIGEKEISFEEELKSNKNEETLSDKGMKFVSLIVRIIVNATVKECYEEGDKVSKV